MAYNYGYPVSYTGTPQVQAASPPAFYPNQQQLLYSQAPQQPTQGMMADWVQGEAAAKAYVVPAGKNAILMDVEEECFYIKSTDASGMPQPLRTFEYKEVVHTEAQASHDQSFNPDDFVKKEDLEELRKEIQKLNSNFGRKDRNNNAK